MTHEIGDRPSDSARSGPVSDESDGAYLDRVADRLEHSYDLERDYRVQGESFDLYGQLRIEHRKQFLHPAITYANHDAKEHLFVRRERCVTRSDFDPLVDLGHTLAEQWIDPDETHYGTEFTFVLIVPEIPETVREFVADFRDRTLLKLGFHGQYELNLLAVSTEHHTIVGSQNADVEAAFALWEQQKPDSGGLIDRLVNRLRS